jgi:hypothetical protein
MFSLTPLLGDFNVRTSQVAVPGGVPTKIVNRDSTRAYLCIQNYVNVQCSVFLATDTAKTVPSWLILASDRLELIWQFHGALVTFELWGNSPGASQGTLLCITELLWLP